MSKYLAGHMIIAAPIFAFWLVVWAMRWLLGLISDDTATALCLSAMYVWVGLSLVWISGQP